jgi:hypothetical protein
VAKLKPGERRQIGVDTSGADGADGRDGLPGARGEDGDGAVRSRPTQARSVPIEPSRPPSGPKRDGKPKIDPLFVKAIPGHMYVIHVVDDVNDFYALFRVEELESGDNCTISWKRITAQTTSAKAK